MGEEIEKLGPLKALVGTWEGEKGADVAPADPDRAKTARSAYRERVVFAPTGRVDNHQQILYGLRYSTTAWRVGQDAPFHEELGYWMWDADRELVIRCFMVPRGVTVIAGGPAASDAKSFALAADVGSETLGICSSPFLDEEFKTVRYEVKVTVNDDGTWTYASDTVLRIKGQAELFHHTDGNTFRKVG